MSKLNFFPGDPKRAVIWFLIIYVGINIPATGLYFLVALAMGTPFSGPDTIIHDPAYLLAQKLYPILNLGLWMLASWRYFKKLNNGQLLLRESIKLGLFWLAVALPMDLIIYVICPTPLSLSLKDFYLGQFPWIYLTYLAVAMSPVVYFMIKRKKHGQ